MNNFWVKRFQIIICILFILLMLVTSELIT